MDQILCGMSVTLNFLELVRQNPKSMRSLFVHQDPIPLTADALYDLLPVQFSPVGSNMREREEEIVMQWNELIQCIEGNIT